MFHDVYFSFDNSDTSNDAIELLYSALGSIGYSCCRCDPELIEQCPIFICFISKLYIERVKIELERAHRADRVILPVVIEKLKLSQTPIGHIVNENEVKYYSTFKKDFDWLSVLTATIIDKFKRIINEDDLDKFELIEAKKTDSYRQLNRICQVGNYYFLADWELDVGVHVLDANYQHVTTFNHDQKLKRVTGICRVKKNQVAVVSSTPNEQYSVYTFQIETGNQGELEIQETRVLSFEKSRDLCGMIYNENRDCLYIADRFVCSIIEVKNDFKSWTEHSLCNSALPKFYKKPILGNLCHDQSGHLYVVDSKRGDEGNCCVHKFQITEDRLKWIGSLGNSELKKPVSVLAMESLTVVLERSNPAVVHIFDEHCKYKNSAVFNGVFHCSSIFMTEKHLLITNLGKRLYIYAKASLEKLSSVHLKLDTIDKFQKLYHVFISYNQHSAKSNALEVFDLLGTNGYNCWLDIKISKVYKEKEIMIALTKVPLVLCLLTNEYVKSVICNKEIEKSFADNKIVVIARMEILSTENEVYINNLKTKGHKPTVFEFDFSSDESKISWKAKVLNEINRAFHKTATEPLCITPKITKKISNSKMFGQINRLCFFDDVIVAGDWELGIGIHFFDLSYCYLKTLNFEGSLKKVTGICKMNNRQMVVVSSVPNTRENAVFRFNYILAKRNSVELSELGRFTDSERERDLCGVEYNPPDNCLYVIDRISCCILKMNENMQVLGELCLKPSLDKRFNEPILRDLKIKNNYIFLTDSFSAKKHKGNNCIHVFAATNEFKWIKTIGEALLSSPSSIIVSENADSIAVLERTSVSALKYFNYSGEMFKTVKLDDSASYPTSITEINSSCFITNDQKSQIIVYDTSNNSKFCCIL